MQSDPIMDALRTYVCREMLEGDESLGPDTPLLELGVLNSMEIMRLLAFIDDQLGVRVPSDCVSADNLRDLRAIAALVRRLSSACEPETHHP